MADKQDNKPRQVHMSKSIAETVDLNKVFDKPVKMEEVFNKPLNIIDASFTNGKRGEYAILQVEDLTTGEQYKVNCGGVILLGMLKSISLKNQFPVSGVFYRNEGEEIHRIRAVVESDFEE